jgi:hypothetical protein
MKRVVFLILLTMMARAEVRRALIVGIDQYMDPAHAGGYQLSEQTRTRLKAIHGTGARTRLESLEGAVNDAQAMKEMLIARFGFEESNVIVLPNPKQPATADNILGLLQSFLVDAANPGDVSVFYFAGHGSRIRNTAAHNDNASHLDSTILPADALLGVPDIRGKELARIYAQAPPKHVALTVILDSCFSGAASRGAAASHRTRDQPVNLDVSVDETLDVPLPEDSGVLILSASQDYEPAAELSSTDLAGAHGAFTWALLHVLGASPPDERVDHVFQRVRALMQSQVPGQEPVLLARHGLNARGLLGQAAGADSRATLAVGRVNERHVRLNGGVAMGLDPGCELKRVHPASPTARVRVTRINGLSSSEGEVIEGGDIHAGDLFEIDKWVSSDRPALRVFMGPSAPVEELKRATEVAASLRRVARGMLVEDPTERAPTHIVAWDGSHWTMKENSPGAKPAVIESLSATVLIRSARSSDARVALLIPPPREVQEAPPGGSVTVVDSIEQADYILMGRACSSGAPQCVEYAWGSPNVTAEDSRDRPSDRPLRSDWVTWNKETPALLNEAARTLARVTGWLRLTSSPASSAWPYHLALQRTDTGQLIEGGEVHGDEKYQLVLRGDPERLKQSAFVAPRRVYVFVVDSWGHAQLVVGTSNLGNEFPRFDAAALTPPETIVLPDSVVTIGGPYGVDHYFLLTTVIPLDSPETILNFDGVRTRGAGMAPTDPLARLLRNTATATRGGVAEVPVNWSIEQMSILSRP